MAIALAMPLAVVAWQLDNQASGRIAAAKAETLLAARAIAREHTALIEDARAILGALAQVPAVREASGSCQPALATVLSVTPWAKSISVVDRGGFIRCSTASSTGMFVGDRAYFWDAAAGDFAVSDVLAARSDGLPVVVAALPLAPADASSMAVVLMLIDIDALTRLAEHGKAPGETQAMLLGPNGRILAVQPPVGPGDTTELVEAIGNEPMGVARASGPDGVRRVFAFTRLPQSSAWIAIGRSEQSVLEPMHRESARVGALLLVVALLTATIAWWFGEAVLLRGISRIANAARDGRRLADAAPDLGAAPEVHALHAALVQNEHRREAAERRWRTLGEAGAQIVWRADPHGRTIEGHGWEALTGKPVSALAEPELGGLMHPDDEAVRAEAWQRALASESLYDVEFRIAATQPDEAELGERTWRWMHSRGVPVRDTTGTVTEWVGTLHDIDDRRHAAAVLAEREARLRSVLETAGDAVLVIDSDGVLQEVNPAAERLFGWPAAELLGQNVAVLMPQAEAALHGGHLARHAAHGDDRVIGMNRELEARRRDGRLVPIEISVARFADAAGRGFYTGILRDVSARRAANAAVAESERRFRLLAENSGDVIMLSDLDGTRRYVSPSSTRVLGWAPEQLVGGGALDLVHPDDRAWLEAGIEAMASGEQTSEATYRCRRPDGTWVWVEGRAQASLGADGRNVGYVATLRDATERKSAEARLLEAFERMEELAATDSLTGLANRRRFDDALRHEWRRAEREQMPLSIALLDADRFKLFNDRYGHPAGDDCLRGLAVALATAARRGGDLPARHGGEEFAMLMPGTDLEGAFNVGERIRALVEADRRPHGGNPPSEVVTVSVGIATAYPWAGSSPASPDGLLSSADDALYAAKAGGRNRVVVATPPTVLASAAE